MKKNLPSFVASFSADRALGPKQLVQALVGLSKGTRFEAAVSQEVGRNPDWGQQMQQRWNLLRNSVADARDGGDTQVPSLQAMVTDRRSRFIKFMATGDERSLARLMRPQVQDAPMQTPPQTPPPTPTRPSSPQEGHVPSPGAGSSPAPGARAQVPPKQDVRAFAESYKLGQMDRDFSPKQLVEAMRALTTGTSFEGAFKAQVETNPQWGRQMQQNWQALRQELDGRNKAGDPGVPSLDQIVGNQAGRTNFIKFLATGKRMERLLPPRPQAAQAPQGLPEAQLERAFQQARELGKALKELAQAEGPAHGHFAIQGRYPLHDKETIETNFERMAQSRHLMGKGPELQAAQQQLKVLLQSGMLEGLQPNEAKELGKLARMDVGAKFEKLAELKDVVDRTRANLRAMGAGGLFEGIRTTPSQRRADLDEERDSHQSALDEGYR